MNKEWAEQNKEMQSLIKKDGTFEKGKDPNGILAYNIDEFLNKLSVNIS